MALPNDFFTINSMLTLSGATGATFVVCNGLQRALDFNPKWLGLAVAQAITLAGVYATGGQDAVAYMIGVVNGFLVYCSAGGATGALAGGDRAGGIARGGVGAADAARPQRSPGHRRFLTPWF